MIQQTAQSSPVSYSLNPMQQAWEFVLAQLRAETSRADFDTWIKPLFPVSCQDGVFTLGTYNSYARDWVENRLGASITRLLSGAYKERLALKVVVVNSFLNAPGVEAAAAAPAAVEAIPAPDAPATQKPAERKKREDSPRKVILERAYGSERAALIQPERTMYLTHYLFLKWLPLLGHSGLAVVLAARSSCYWNPANNETRNVYETDMAELAQRASVSVRTVKDVLASELVKRYFIRYVVRRHMTPNGVRTAGITLAVRMDDPLTPEDQAAHNLKEDEHWYPPMFDGEEDEE